MNRVINFAKVQSTGNDFILIDCNNNHIQQLDKEHIIKMCNRRFGIGADGLIFVTLAGRLKIDMTYYNADGSITAVCGNGLRAVAQFARVMGMVKSEDAIIINAGDGPHEAYFENRNIAVEIITGTKIDHIDKKVLNLPGLIKSAAFTDTGVPHLVLETNELDAIDVNRLGKELRLHSYFEPDGTNVNFVQTSQPNELFVRTFERGIEGETLSCGTGVVAAVLVHWESMQDKPSLNIKVKGGMLAVFKKNGKIYLSGPSSIEFVGQYLINKLNFKEGL